MSKPKEPATEPTQTSEHLLSTMVIVPVRHEFSNTELLEKSNEIAECVSTKAKLEAEKKTNAAEFKNKIDKEAAQITLLSGHINNKYATVDKACELYANFDTKKREYRLKETGEVVKVEDLHASDYNILQQRLDLDKQVEENNEAGEYAEGGAKVLPMNTDDDDFFAATDDDDDLPL